ncbi:MAG TPA: hypothetical protein VKI41_16575, partial [Vicinamibacteria bacterium]|nr:hypothetical protein [Vicinamibacteria bacterium]
MTDPHSPYAILAAVLDLKFVVENKERVLRMLEARGQSPGEADPWGLDGERRALIQKVERLRHDQKVFGLEIAGLRKAGQDPSSSPLSKQLKDISEEIKSLEVR